MIPNDGWYICVANVMLYILFCTILSAMALLQLQSVVSKSLTMTFSLVAWWREN